MERGYVKLYRSIDDNELLANDNTCYLVFSKLLTHADRFTGTYKTGRFKLAALCNLKPTTLYAALKRLESSTMIRQQSDNKMTAIYICNWWKYQQDDDSTVTDRRRANDTKQEREKEREYINSGVTKQQRELLRVLNHVTGRSFKVLPKSSKATLRSFTIEEIERALSKLVVDKWHKPKVGELSSDYFLRESTIDKFLSSKSEAKKSIESLGDVDKSKLNLSRKRLAEMEYGHN